MNLIQYLDRLRDMDPDTIVDELGITSEELVNKFKNKAKSHFYRVEYEEEDDEGEEY